MTLQIIEWREYRSEAPARLGGRPRHWMVDRREIGIGWVAESEQPIMLAQFAYERLRRSYERFG